MDEFIEDCKETMEKLYEFLDGELTDARRVVIRRHLDDCSPCLEAFEFESELRVMISSKSKERCPEELLSRIAKVIRAEQDGGTRERNITHLA